ncbi:hypothetical protein MTBLM5_40154 [Magnetospirillum sp. LM-5]|nr:hypothetical protein MTBLM5_40154 [Magnetospirillum sp. LM-5]
MNRMRILALTVRDRSLADSIAFLRKSMDGR